jgi:peptide-methionine (R)-S-oxide reductase
MLLGILAFSMMHLGSPQNNPYQGLATVSANQHFAVVKSDDEWKRELPYVSYEILRHAETERAFTGKFWDNHADGVYVCAGCGQVLFSSKTKFESGTGWPSFYEEIAHGRTMIRADDSLGMERDEVICSRCGGHLGHVFDDGPAPTHLRYCMNSAALKFIPKK